MKIRYNNATFVFLAGFGVGRGQTPISAIREVRWTSQFISILLNYAGQSPVVQKVDNAIHWINHYPVDSAVCFVNTYPPDSDLSGG